MNFPNLTGSTIKALVIGNEFVLYHQYNKQTTSSQVNFAKQKSSKKTHQQEVNNFGQGQCLGLSFLSPILLDVQ